MAICPKCNEEINELQTVILEENKYAFSIHKDQTRWSESEVVEGSESYTRFHCPKCDEVLIAGDWKDTVDLVAEATKFLSDSPENVPCEKCGNKDLPLHYNRLCPDCFVVPDKESS